MPANYDNAAWFYDRLQRLIYGNRLVQAQIFLIKHIPAGGRLLIAGGGTGSILDEINKLYPSGLDITYIELSARMIALSKKRNLGTNHVQFIIGDAGDLQLHSPYDAIITPFLFDNFTQEGLIKLFSHLHQQLKPAGLWLNADFQLTGKWWQPLLLKTMYFFFHVLGCVNVSRLPDIEGQFNNYQYEPVAQKTFSGEFVKSTVYQRK